MLYQQRSCKEELALIFESYSVNCKRNKLEHQEAEPKDARVRIPTTLPDDRLKRGIKSCRQAHTLLDRTGRKIRQDGLT
jgi:hypothetical protein